MGEYDQLIKQACLEAALREVRETWYNMTTRPGEQCDPSTSTRIEPEKFEDDYEEAYVEIIRTYMYEPTTTIELHLCRELMKLRQEKGVPWQP